jgi:hypothetical protein
MGPQTIKKPLDLKAFQPKARPYKVSAGQSLFLLVMPHGSMLWRMKYRLNGTEKQFAIGAYPEVSLSQAQEARDQARLLLKDGIDPVEARRNAAKDRPKPESEKNTFRIELSRAGELTIETESRIIRLIPPQTAALQSFLKATPVPQSINRRYSC